MPGNPLPTRPGDARFRVRYAETDQMGVVYYGNYAIWMELGRVELLRAMGFRYRDLEEQHGILIAVTECRCRYLAPARYDDEIIVRAQIAESGSRMVRFTYDIFEAAESKLLASGETRHVFLNRQMSPTRLPDLYRSAFQVTATEAER